jgi:hypothetical protein
VTGSRPRSVATAKAGRGRVLRSTTALPKRCRRPADPAPPGQATEPGRAGGRQWAMDRRAWLVGLSTALLPYRLSQAGGRWRGPSGRAAQGGRASACSARLLLTCTDVYVRTIQQ